MKALIIQKGHLKLEELPVRRLDNGAVRVRVRAAGICATDLHILSSRIKFERTPRILGHEVAGIVESVGKGVSADWAGKSVVVDPVIGCGTCYWCHSGRKLLCRNGGELGTTGGDGGYAEYVTVPATNLYVLPEQLTFEEGALLEPLNCTFGAFCKAQPRPGQSVLVFGSGPAGLLFVELAQACGCGPILLVGGGAARLDLGRKLGAAETWSYRDGELAGHVRRATNGEGPDIAIEAAGAHVAVQQAFDWVRPGGRVVLYGISGAPTPNIPSDLIVTKDLTVVTGIGSPLLWDEVIRFASAGKINLLSLVTHRFPLEDFENALSVAADSERAVKVMLCPSATSGNSGGLK
jgi:threonine dehydrogenase-like Zn-dependent dehydrogenase